MTTDKIVDFKNRKNCSGQYRKWEELISGTAVKPTPPGGFKPLIALVVPPSPFTVPRGWGYYLARPFEGISYIATVLSNAGYRVKIVDARYKPAPLEYALSEIAGADVVGIATYEDGFPFIEKLAALAKKKFPARPVILGGSLVTSIPELMMRHVKADVAVIGEGELTILELMEAYCGGTLAGQIDSIPGLCYRGPHGKPLLTAPRKQLSNLDILPVPDFTLWKEAGGGLLRQNIVSGSRGCHKNCSFCYRTTPKLGLKSPEKLRRELELLKKKHKTEFFQFTDLTFTFSKKRTLALCEVLKGLRVKWWCMTRVEDVDAEVLGVMADAGCEQILYGVESLSQAALDEARKGFSEDETVRAMKLTRDAGITVGAAYVIGLPGESPETLERAAAFAAGLGTPCRVKYLSAIPGTGVYADAVKSGAIKSELSHLCGLLAKERGLADDDFLNLTGLPEPLYREVYRKIEARYVPGPYGTAELVKAKHFYTYPDTPLGEKEIRSVLEEDARLVSGSLLE
ncbi:MAG: cobalamin B12-binding domain-containing protein [Elusimicrobia bacterium]|nr:cobalamin B12-binding domain-containing protein [Elusimicrobiota bacterium]